MKLSWLCPVGCLSLAETANRANFSCSLLNLEVYKVLYPLMYLLMLIMNMHVQLFEEIVFSFRTVPCLKKGEITKIEKKSRFNSAIRIKTKMLSSTRILTFLLSSLLVIISSVTAQDDRCPRPEAIAPCQCRTRGPTIQGKNSN